MIFRWNATDRTWAVLCEDWEHVIESGYYALTDAMAEVSEGDCSGCAERQAEARSGIPREYAEC